MASTKLRQYELAQSPAGILVLSRALELLRPHLPQCLPLYRRLQFGRFSKSAVLFTNLDFQSPDGRMEREGLWLAAFVDRGSRPETQVWMFGSWEAEGGGHEWEGERERGMLWELLGVVKGLEVGRSIFEDEVEVDRGVSRDVVGGEDVSSVVNLSESGVITPLSNAGSECSPVNDGYADGSRRKDDANHPNSDIMWWGAIHERTVPILQKLGVLSLANKTALVPCSTFIFKLDNLPYAPPLPACLEWSTVEIKDFALVRSRTQIPRHERTMAVMPSLAIRPISRSINRASEEVSQPIAWAFVGLDGSLTTLHVEPEWRGRGLAKAIAAKLFREKMHSFWEPGMDRMSHGYVVSGNKASEATCRSLGGMCGWQNCWVSVNLQTVGEEVEASQDPVLNIAVV